MIKILFVCHGNICRSPMAEFVFRDMVNKKGLSDHFSVASAATSTEEIGNPVHHGTRNKLAEYGISTKGKTAIQLTRKDYRIYHYLIGMDSRNIANMQKIMGPDTLHKVFRLLDFTIDPRDIADPWYSGDFDLTFSDITYGCKSLLEFIMNRENKRESENKNVT